MWCHTFGRSARSDRGLALVQLGELHLIEPFQTVDDESAGNHQRAADSCKYRRL